MKKDLSWRLITEREIFFYSVTAYLSISFVERESRSQKDQKRCSEVHTEGLPGIIIYYLNVLQNKSS